MQVPTGSKGKKAVKATAEVAQVGDSAQHTNCDALSYYLLFSSPHADAQLPLHAAPGTQGARGQLWRQGAD